MENRPTNSPPPPDRSAHAWARLALGWAYLLLVVGTALTFLTMANGDPASPLPTAAGCGLLGAVLLGTAMYLGSPVVRGMAAIGFLPIAWIALQCVTRIR